MEERPLPPDESHSKTFLARCEQCGASKELHLCDLDLNADDPFQYTCVCGNACRAVLSQPRAPRKTANFICSFKVASDARKVDRFADVLDVSASGMRIATDPIKGIAEGESLAATILLDNKQKTKVELRGVIRRIVGDKPRLVLGVEFQDLTDNQRKLLAPYVAAAR
jgi:hypothetical protein